MRFNKLQRFAEKVAKRISEAFKGVASFSTRDQNTHDFVASLTDADIEDNLDPVLIYNFDDELEDVEMPRVPEHYCVITHITIEFILEKK